ncbi:unnamed protein product [Phytophthora lilii]|uniref:Unnamed protein product n=1 Tax=Phytophthora lilii TaxID=2077276 RepID=A0A9W7CYD7_9STRA|nr:unnamed protein product [Phytophthora lilii]
MKASIAGGPSIIFICYAKRNETKIRGGKVCKKIIGYDANALKPAATAAAAAATIARGPLTSTGRTSKSLSVPGRTTSAPSGFDRGIAVVRAV